MEVFGSEYPQGLVLEKLSFVGVKKQQLLELTLESIILSVVGLM